MPSSGYKDFINFEKVFRSFDGNVYEINDDSSLKFPFLIFYPSGENSGGSLDIKRQDFIQRIEINKNGKTEVKKFNTKGFSLIEVVVSLVILSISILAIYQVIISNTTSIMYLEDRYLAKEVTNNRVALINTIQKPNSATKRTGIMKMGNKVWRWEEIIEKKFIK